MSNLKGTANYKNLVYTGRSSVLLPPKGPFQSIYHSDADYGSSAGSKSIPKSEGYRLRKCTSSQGSLYDEQPSWLDELLNEPETPVKRGVHRRSSSDSSAYLGLHTNPHDIDNTPWDEDKSGNMASVPLWGSLDFDHFRDAQHTSYAESSLRGEQNILWESPLNSIAYTSSHPSSREKVAHQHPGPSRSSQELDGVSSIGVKKQDQEESRPRDSQDSSKKGDYNYDKPSSSSETDQKRAKQ
ncbi:hypothetical protein ACLOJK_016809 [Asimina triloba]